MMENKNSRPCGPTLTEAKTNKSESNSLVGKSPGYGGKKKDGGNWVGGGNYSSGPAPGAVFKNQKSVQSKPRIFDKRFKSLHVGNGTFRKNGHQVTDSNDPDLESILPEKWKKENLAHLLNMKFQLAPRDSPYRHTTHSPGDKYHHSNHASRHTYTKDRYLQANCQFVVKDDGDYTAYLTNPDLLVPWENIEQIRIWGSEVASCPICLLPPVAARITRCGHIYCWPCILHFLALSDKASRPCPICDAPVKDGDLKSVVALEQRDFKVGHTIEFRLMKCDRLSLLPQPVHHNPSVASPSVGVQRPKPMYLNKAGENHVFSKLLLATAQDVSEILRSEEKELLSHYENEKDCPESCFIEQALERILLDERRNLSSTVVDSNAAFVLSPSQIRHQLNQQKNVFYFYQSSDGQAIFMHSLNVQMLVSQYGSLEFCPEIIEGEIVEGEYISMDEDIRKRMRYLGHIPISKQFQIFEITLNESCIDASILEEFRDRIDERERRRRRKFRDEKRRDLKIQQAEDAKWGHSKIKPIVKLDSQKDFPAFSPSSDEWEGPPLPLQPEPIFREVETVVEPNTGTSFASMLREGKNKSTSFAWPAASRSVAPSTTSSGFRSDSENEPECEGYVPVPEYRETFSSALAAAFDQAAKLTDDSPVKTEDNKPVKKGKRKVKQKVLFTFG